jgi:ABC-type nitrate/sulfonate/bicarbonate transport system ATPase subunit
VHWKATIVFVTHALTRLCFADRMLVMSPVWGGFVKLLDVDLPSLTADESIVHTTLLPALVSTISERKVHV